MSRFAVIAVALPLVGAAAIAVASCFGLDLLAAKPSLNVTRTVRRIALTAAALTFGVLLCSVVVDLVLGPRAWEGGGGIFALLTSAVWLPAVSCGRECDSKRADILYGLLLFLEAAFLAVFLADDALLFCVSLESSTLVLFLLISGWGGRGSDPVARKFLLYNLVADMLVLTALLGLVIAAGRMQAESRPNSSHELSYSLGALTRNVPRMTSDDISAQEYWGHARRWLLTALILGVIVKTPLVPFHRWFAPAIAEGPLCASLALLIAGLGFGTYALVRIVQPLCSDLGIWGGLLVALIVLGAVHQSLLAMAHGEVRKLIACASLSQASLAAAGFFSQQRPGVVGAVLLAIATGLASTLLMFSFGFLEMRFDRRDLSGLGEIWRRFPQVSCVLLVGVLSMVGIPGLCGFSGLFPVLGSLFAFGWLSALLAMIAVLIVGWALFWMLERMVFAPLASIPVPSSTTDGASAESARRDSPGDLRPAELLVIAPLITGIVLIGLRPQAFVDLIVASLRNVFLSS